MNERFARLHLLLGAERLSALSQSTVMVIGLGGVGSSCAEALARGGIGRLILIDGDTVEESNINRQALAFTSTIGMPKSSAMDAMVKEINPDCETFPVQVFLEKGEIAAVLGSLPRPDYVIDCIDAVAQKLDIAQWCATEQIPLTAAMGAANKLDPSRLRFANIRKTGNCPLSKVIRRVADKRGLRGYEVLYSHEEPIVIADKGTGSKAETLGTMSYMPPIMGQMLAGKVLRRLAGFEEMREPPTLVSVPE